MKITVYSTTTCPYCVMLKNWLDNKGVKYEEYLVDKNPYAAQMMLQKSGQMSVPFSTIEHDDGNIDMIRGFDRDTFTASLEKRL